jgi:hypothetical protein
MSELSPPELACLERYVELLRERLARADRTLATS